MASANSQLAGIPQLQEADLLLDQMRLTISYTPVKIFAADGSFTEYRQADNYYVNNDVWDVRHFLELEQFSSFKDAEWAKLQNYKIHFAFNQKRLNLEAKYVFHQMIFSDKWSLSASFTATRSAMSRLSKYINEHRPDITSFAEMQGEVFEEEYASYLSELGLTTYYKEKGRKGYKKSSNLAIPSVIFNHLQIIQRENYFSSLTTELWDEDAWHLQYFRKFGLDASEAGSVKTIVFTGIESESFKALLKRYLKEKLLTRSIRWSTAHGKAVTLKPFLNFIHDRYPDWDDLKALSRKDMTEYLERLTIYANTELKQYRKDANPGRYPKAALSEIRTFLDDLQFMEYPEAPIKPAIQIIRPDDTKGYTQVDMRKVKYVPDFVLRQFFDHIDAFPEKYLPVVLTMYYTGLRISDVLELKQSCLVRINGNYWVETYVRKTDTFDHRCPITDEFAKILQKYITAAKNASNDDNNPNHLIFVNFRGAAKGHPYNTTSVATALNTYAEKYNIVDENGNRFHFKNHAFRHTFSVKMINSGADILTVMQLLAHATPKMTLVYAKLLDDTKRVSFEEAVKSGVFTFSPTDGETITYEGNVPQDIVDNLWQAHKLNATDTPYGTCLQRKKGKCSFSKQPPCLTCNEGKPCRDLCVGAFEGDSDKYSILIDSAKRLINTAEQHNRSDMAEENRQLLDIYIGIKDIIDGGGMIYGRMDRLKGSSNE